MFQEQHMYITTQQIP